MLKALQETIRVHCDVARNEGLPIPNTIMSRGREGGGGGRHYSTTHSAGPDKCGGVEVWRCRYVGASTWAPQSGPSTSRINSPPPPPPSRLRADQGAELTSPFPSRCSTPDNNKELAPEPPSPAPASVGGRPAEALRRPSTNASRAADLRHKHAAAAHLVQRSPAYCLKACVRACPMCRMATGEPHAACVMDAPMLL